jgi:hypothetical protein
LWVLCRIVTALAVARCGNSCGNLPKGKVMRWLQSSFHPSYPAPALCAHACLHLRGRLLICIDVRTPARMCAHASLDVCARMLVWRPRLLRLLLICHCDHVCLYILYIYMSACTLYIYVHPRLVYIYRCHACLYVCALRLLY